MLDDCWSWTSRDANGNLQPDPNRFPHGIPALATELHARGLKLGLYTSAGPTTCSSGNRSGKIPGSYGHYQQDAELYKAWGVDAMTMDWCDWHFNDTVMVPSIKTREMSDALNATGWPVWFLFHCVGYDIVPTEWCAEYGNSYTIWTDHHDNWNTTMSILGFMASHPAYAGGETLTWPDPDFLM
jgi:alpha-galactosidase